MHLGRCRCVWILRRGLAGACHCVRRLQPPLGLGPGATSMSVLQFVYALDIPLINGRVPFHRWLTACQRGCQGGQAGAGWGKHV